MIWERLRTGATREQMRFERGGVGPGVGRGGRSEGRVGVYDLRRYERGDAEAKDGTRRKAAAW